MTDVIKDEYELNPNTRKMSRNDKGAPYFYAFTDEDARDLYFNRYPHRLREEVICVLTGTKYLLDFSEDDGDNTMYLPLLYP